MKEVKRNFFGTNKKTAGQNLVFRLFGCEHEVGIPSYNYDNAIKIMSTALDPIELAIYCKGFGLNCPRQTQKEIAADLGMTPLEVCAICWKALDKLKAQPTKAQLKGLIVTLENLFSKIEKLEKETVSAKELKSTRKKLEAAENSLAESEKAREKLVDQNSKLTYELEHTRRQAEVEKAALNKRIIELATEVEHEKHNADAVKAAFQKATAQIKEGFDSLMTEAGLAFTEAVAVSKILDNSLERLNLSEGALEQLKRAGIDNIDNLCKMDRHSLRRMGVSIKHIIEIEEALKANGLSLRIG